MLQSKRLVLLWLDFLHAPNCHNVLSSRCGALLPRFLLTRDTLIMDVVQPLVRTPLSPSGGLRLPVSSLPLKVVNNTNLQMLVAPLTGWPRTPNVIFALSI